MGALHTEGRCMRLAVAPWRTGAGRTCRVPAAVGSGGELHAPYPCPLSTHRSACTKPPNVSSGITSTCGDRRSCSCPPLPTLAPPAGPSLCLPSGGQAAAGGAAQHDQAVPASPGTHAQRRQQDGGAAHIPCHTGEEPQAHLAVPAWRPSCTAAVLRCAGFMNPCATARSPLGPLQMCGRDSQCGVAAPGPRWWRGATGSSCSPPCSAI